MRSSTLTIALFATFLSGGCGNDEWLAPTPLPTAPAVPAEVWDLTTTLTSVTGPACLTVSQTQPLGNTTEWPLKIRRDGSAIALSYGQIDDQVELVGSTNGETFTAVFALRPTGAAFQCDDVVAVYQFESRVTGQFSADGRKLTANETWTFRFATLEPLVLSFDWTATLP